MDYGSINIDLHMEGRSLAEVKISKKAIRYDRSPVEWVHNVCERQIAMLGNHYIDYLTTIYINHSLLLPASQGKHEYS